MADQRGRVLLIHDEEDAGAALAQVLEHDGYEVQRATSAARAIRDLRKVDPSVVVTRNQMPMLSGRHVLRAMSAARVDIPVVITARGGDLELVVELMRSGASDCVLDPLRHPGDLTQAVGRAMARVEEMRSAARLEAELTEARADLVRSLEAEATVRKRAFDRVREPLDRATQGLVALRGQGLLAAQREVLETALADLYMVHDQLHSAHATANRTSTRSIKLTEFHPLDLAESVRDAILKDAHSRGAEVAWFVPSELPPLRGDPQQLRAVLVDLCGFLIAGRAGGAVHFSMTVNARGPGPWLIRFDVSDAEAMAAIEGEDVIESQLPGDDIEMVRDELIDLSLTHRVVEALGGELALYERKGSGRRFSFELAILKAKTDLLAHVDPGLVPADVLVVEPHAHVRRCLNNELVKLGMRTAPAGSAEQAIQLLERARAAGKDFAVVFLSLSVPDRGRVDEWLKGPGRGIRLVFLSRAGEYAPALGDAMLMMRPPKRKVLVEVLRRFVGVRTSE